MSAITDSKQIETYSTPDQIAAVVYEAATDGKRQLRYVAGADATATYAADQATVLRIGGAFIRDCWIFFCDSADHVDTE